MRIVLFTTKVGSLVSELATWFDKYTFWGSKFRVFQVLLNISFIFSLPVLAIHPHLHNGRIVRTSTNT